MKILFYYDLDLNMQKIISYAENIENIGSYQNIATNAQIPNIQSRLDKKSTKIITIFFCAILLIGFLYKIFITKNTKPIYAVVIKYDRHFIDSGEGCKIAVKREEIDKYNNIWKNYFYRDSNLLNIQSFIVNKVKNINIKTEMQKYMNPHNQYELGNKFNNTFGKNSITITKGILSTFNNDFARSYLFFKNCKNFSEQESVDQAYMQAYRTFIELLNDVSKYSNYIKEMNQFYQDNPDYIFIGTKEYQ